MVALSSTDSWCHVVVGSTRRTDVTAAYYDVTTVVEVWHEGRCSANLVEEELVEDRPACAWAGCRREADTRGFYGGRMVGMCQLHRAMSDRRLRSGGRR